jgi:hypothetical protein
MRPSANLGHAPIINWEVLNHPRIDQRARRAERRSIQ